MKTARCPRSRSPPRWSPAAPGVADRRRSPRAARCRRSSRRRARRPSGTRPSAYRPCRRRLDRGRRTDPHPSDRAGPRSRRPGRREAVPRTYSYRPHRPGNGMTCPPRRSVAGPWPALRPAASAACRWPSAIASAASHGHPGFLRSLSIFPGNQDDPAYLPAAMPSRWQRGPKVPARSALFSPPPSRACPKRVR